jgi:YbbR domain-containing protein
MFKLTLKGRTATLAAITKQQIVPYIDVLDMGDGNGHRNVSILSLGNNVVLSESPALNIYVETIATYSIDSNRILLTNIDTNLIYSIQNETFNMRLVGLSADISDTDISEMKFYVNVQDLREGVHMVDVIVKDVNLPENVRFYEDMQVAVEITAP